MNKVNGYCEKDLYFEVAVRRLPSKTAQTSLYKFESSERQFAHTYFVLMFRSIYIKMKCA